MPGIGRRLDGWPNRDLNVGAISAATLADVVAHYNRVRSLGFTTAQQADLVEYLKTR
jgi:hypothetical protein